MTELPLSVIVQQQIKKDIKEIKAEIKSITKTSEFYKLILIDKVFYIERTYIHNHVKPLIENLQPNDELTFGFVIVEQKGRPYNIIVSINKCMLYKEKITFYDMVEYCYNALTE